MSDAIGKVVTWGVYPQSITGVVIGVEGDILHVRDRNENMHRVFAHSVRFVW